MKEFDPSAALSIFPANTLGTSSPASQTRSFPVIFTRLELNEILRVYGFKVAEGEWRDYAIDLMQDRAVFSVFKRASEQPLYTIEKKPALARKQGAYSVVTVTGLILKRGHELRNVLRVFNKKPGLVEFDS